MKRKRPHRPSKTDTITATTMQHNAHESTEDIVRLHTVLACERNTIDREILVLAARNADARLRRAKVDATIKGLEAVVEKRR